jgi:hypothetical protein
MLAHRLLRRMYPGRTRTGLHFVSEQFFHLSRPRPWARSPRYETVNQPSAAGVAKRTPPKRIRPPRRPQCHPHHYHHVFDPWLAQPHSLDLILCAHLQVLHEQSL